MAAWLALIAGIFQLLGPILDDCAKKRLERAAKRLPAPSTFATEGEAVAALHDKAIAQARLPRVKKALQSMKQAMLVGGKLRTKPLSAEEVQVAKAVVAKASRR